MRILKYILAFSIGVFATRLSFAQGEIKFKEVTYDFGRIDEGTIASHEFICTNIAQQPVVISQANPSCGCTVSDYTKGPIPGGKTGTVKATYNSSGRPGTFVKTITVISNGREPAIQLTIKGTVVPKSQTPSLTKEQMDKSPLLKLDKKLYSFGTIEKGKSITTEFKIQNNGRSELKISSISSPCHCVTISRLSKNSIAPRDSATIELSYKPYGTGQLDEKINIFSNDVVNPKVLVTLQANVVESLTTQSTVKEEKTKAPF